MNQDGAITEQVAEFLRQGALTDSDFRNAIQASFPDANCDSLISKLLADGWIAEKYRTGEERFSLMYVLTNDARRRLGLLEDC